jgi:hypothetical protein
MYHSIELTTTILSIKNSISRPPLRRGLPRKQIHVLIQPAISNAPFRSRKRRANRDFVASQLDRESLANAQRRAAEFVPKKQGKALPTFYGVADGRRRQRLPKFLLDTSRRN